MNIELTSMDHLEVSFQTEFDYSSMAVRHPDLWSLQSLDRFGFHIVEHSIA